jgi:hypothetical protein
MPLGESEPLEIDLTAVTSLGAQEQGLRRIEVPGSYAIFYFSQRPDLWGRICSVANGTDPRSIVYETGILEMERRQLLPVSSWKTCPFCRRELDGGLEHIVDCQCCGRCFTDPAWAPVVSGRDGVWALTGEREWEPVWSFEDDGLTRRARAWIIGPPGASPAVVPDPVVDHGLDELQEVRALSDQQSIGALLPRPLDLKTALA